MTKGKVKLPKSFLFRLNMVDFDERAEECCKEEFQEFQGDYPICAYEKYLYIYYMINAGQDICKLYCESLVSKSFYSSITWWLKRLTHSFVHNHPIIRKYTVDKLEAKLNAIPELRELCAKHYNKEGYVRLTGSAVLNLPQYTSIIYDHVSNLMKDLKAWCDKQDLNTIDKSYYLRHLHCFLKLAGIKNTNVRKIAEYMILCQNHAFEMHLGAMYYKTNEAPPILAGCKNFKVSDLLKYMNILFSNNVAGAFQNKCMDSKFLLSSFVYSICFTETATDEQFYEKCLPALKKTELTLKDFKHIEQLPYLVTLLENALKEKRKGINILLYGKPGTGKTALAKVLIQAVTSEGYEVLNTDWKGVFDERFVRSGESGAGNKLRIDNFYLIKQILRQNSKSVILYDEAEDFFRKKDDISQSKGVVNDVLEENKNPTIWTTNSITCLEESYFRRFTYVLNVEELPRDLYKEMLDKLANKYNLELDEDTENICMQYKPNLGLIDKSFSNFQLSGYDDQEFLRTNLLDALKGQKYGEDLDPLVNNKFSFYPELLNTSIDLRELTEQIKSNGRLDFSLLLYGVPGSSKTSFGRYLGEQLGLKVINRNYTELASMYVGETEHNIADLFRDGTRDQALIILDECDVLLRDRAQARASWEVSQTEALLTEMERYEYPFIMTTNLYDTLDPAVMRRILYKVKHDYLTPDQVKLAFKLFFGLTIRENLHLSRLSSGDFAVVKKQAEFQGKLKDKAWLIERLSDEMSNKREFRLASNSIKM